MEIHKAKPWHGFREFGLDTLGVSGAVSAEH
jgi:hypothetical protein